MKDVRIALVQMESIVGETEENLCKIEYFVKEAKKNNVHMICFPELAVHGYNKNKLKELSEKIPGPISDRISALAAENGMAILAGMIEKTDEECPYITQLICFSSGRVYAYRKTHLGLSEREVYTPGNELPVYHTEQADFGIQICWETHYPEIAIIQSLKGAEVIYTPFASPVKAGSRRDIWMKYLPARAYDNSVFIAACNLIGANGLGQDFSGGCIIIDPKGNVIAEDFSDKEGMLIADLSCNEINDIRSGERKSMKTSFFLKYRRKELYGELLK